MGQIVPVKNSILRLPDARNLSARFAGDLPFGPDHIAKIQDLFGSSIIGFYPGAEASGVAALDYSLRGFTGAYTGVTLGQPGLGGLTCPLYDGALDYMQPPAGFRSAFNGAEGTVGGFAKFFSDSMPEDTITRNLVNIQVDANNWIRVEKSSLANGLSFLYIAGAVNEFISLAPLSGNAFFHWAFTWSKSNEIVIAYFRGAQIGSSGTLGTWSGIPVAGTTLFGARDTTPAVSWNGYEQYDLVLNRAATPAEVAVMAVI
jgi:hypothetical protein